MVVGFLSEKISRGFAPLGICWVIFLVLQTYQVHPSPKFIIQSQGWQGKKSQDVRFAKTMTIAVT